MKKNQEEELPKEEQAVIQPKSYTSFEDGKQTIVSTENLQTSETIEDGATTNSTSDKAEEGEAKL